MVPYQAFEEFVELQLGANGAALSSEVLSALFDQFVDQRLLARWGLDRGLSGVDAEPIAVVLDQVEIPPPTDAEIRAFYLAAPQRFDRPLRVRLRQLLVEDEATARRAVEQIESGVEFSHVAKRLGAAGKGAVGSLQGVVSRSEVPPVYEPVIFALAEGEVSEVVRAEYGYHVFQVVERLPERRLTLEEATPEIRRELERLATERALGSLVKRAAERYNIEVHERNLPFRYRGRYSQTSPLSDPS